MVKYRVLCFTVCIITSLALFYGVLLHRQAVDMRFAMEQVLLLEKNMQALTIAHEELTLASRELEEKKKEAELQAGLTPVEGKGIRIVLDNRSIDGEVAKSVNYVDLLVLVNELNAAGAMAISINGTRYTANTEIRTAGAYIAVGENVKNPPFILYAAGDQRVIEESLLMYGGIVERLKEEYSVAVEKCDVYIPAKA